MWTSARVNFGSSVIDSKSVNGNVKILNCGLGPLVMFRKLCLESYKSVKLVSGKPVALEMEVNRRERAGSFLVVPNGWYLETSPRHCPRSVPDTRCKGNCACVRGDPEVLNPPSRRCLVIVWEPDPLFLLNKTEAVVHYRKIIKGRPRVF